MRSSIEKAVEFQYRKRYEITCDLIIATSVSTVLTRFNTASGMRSHVTECENIPDVERWNVFQYRKRYEITCDMVIVPKQKKLLTKFQYRKRYEITCDKATSSQISFAHQSFNTASGMRSHVTSNNNPSTLSGVEVSIPQAV